MKKILNGDNNTLLLSAAGLVLVASVVVGCSSDENAVTGVETDTSGTADAGTDDSGTSDSGTDDSGTSTDVSEGSDSCIAVAASFQTKGSANADLPDPEVNAVCNGDIVFVTSNQIPDFPYIETSPGLPEAFDLEFEIPAVPVLAAEVSAVASIGAIGVAINGIPIYGATEGSGGDVMALSGGFTECGGHNGPTGYHFHTFDVTGTDVCLFSEAEASSEPQLYGYAFDGFPIYSGNFQYNSSWSLTDASLFASDTFSAHTYIEGSGDLDQCNGRTDDNGNYAYYTTETFPYTLGCYSGEIELESGETETRPPPGG